MLPSVWLPACTMPLSSSRNTCSGRRTSCSRSCAAAPLCLLDTCSTKAEEISSVLSPELARAEVDPAGVGRVAGEEVDGGEVLDEVADAKVEGVEVVEVEGDGVAVEAEDVAVAVDVSVAAEDGVAAEVEDGVGVAEAEDGVGVAADRPDVAEPGVAADGPGPDVAEVTPEADDRPGVAADGPGVAADGPGPEAGVSDSEGNGVPVDRGEETEVSDGVKVSRHHHSGPAPCCTT